MRPNRSARPPFGAPAAALALVLAAATLALGAAGCSEERRGSTHEERTASAVALGDQSVLRIETRSADVRLIQSPDDTVRIVTLVRIQSATRSSVDALARQVKLTMERQGAELILRVREPERGRTRVNVSAGPWRLRRSVEIDVTVAVPARARLECETARGDFEAVGLAQAASFVSTSGDVDLSQLGGPVRVQTTSGDVTLRDLAQPPTLRLTAGDVDAVGIAGPLTIRATSGDLSVRQVRGGVRLETSTGDIEAEEIEGSTSISTSAGDVVLGLVAGDTCVVETASGDIEARLDAAPRLVNIRSSAGDVDFRLPAGVGGSIDVQTATGAIRVRSAIEVQTMNRNRLTGRLGGTGSVAIRTSSGDITLATNPGGTP